MLYKANARTIFAYVQSSAIVSVHVTADMHLVFCRLVFDVEEPVLYREPVIGGRFLPLQAKSVAARCGQKVKPFQSHPVVQCVVGTEAVLVISPRQVPAESTRHVALHPHDPVENGNHWNGSLGGNREGYRLVLRHVVCYTTAFTICSGQQ